MKSSSRSILTKQPNAKQILPFNSIKIIAMVALTLLLVSLPCISDIYALPSSGPGAGGSTHRAGSVAVPMERGDERGKQ